MTAGIGGIEQIDGLQAVLADIAAAGPEMAAAGTNGALAWVRTEVEAGRDPNTGQAWDPTKRGTRPLQNAAGALSARMVGTTGLLILGGHYVWHFFGSGYLPKRRANLQGRLPERAGDAIRLGMLPVFEAKTKRGKMGTAKYEAQKAKRGAA